MRINQNIPALNTHSRLTAANNSKSNSLAKLSSGLRINKAGDDAAGLAISEKMRGQVGGLKQSIRNAQDGTSLIQTAEGALTETHSILNRMRDLAVQSANDSNTDDDRMEIQKEIEQLTKEVTRISTDTEFNTMKLLNGNFDEKGLVFHVGANSQQNVSLNIKNMGGVALGIQSEINVTKDQFDSIESKDLVFKEAGSSYAAEEIKNGTQLTGITTVAKGTEVDIVKLNKEIETSLETLRGEIAKGTADAKENYEKALEEKETILSNVGTVNKGGYYEGAAGVATKMNEDVKIQIDSKLSAKDLAKGSKLKAGEELATAGASALDLTTQEGADTAITIIDNAVKSVSGERAKLGSAQNRLEHTINNLTATRENLAAAEGRIRDVDMAEEMMEFTRTNILSQAATAMLAQANQMPQSVLQLLQ